MLRLHGMDAMFVYTETPNVHAHTIKVGILDVGPLGDQFSIELFRELLRRRLYLLDPFRYRLLEVPLRLHHPVWMENAEVDLNYHVRPVRLPAPGGRRELDEFIGEIAGTQLDRSRPLWELYVVDGMADGSVPVVVKIHHALADGVASGNLLARMMRFTATADDEREPPPPAAPPSTAELFSMIGRDYLRLLLRLPVLLGQTVGGVWRLRRAARRRAQRPQLAGRFSPSPTFINHPLSPGRRFASATLALYDIKETSSKLDIKINDLVLATAAGALRELLLRHDGRADHPMIASVPTSLDADSDRIAGNRVGAMNVSLPVQVADPLERVRLTALACALGKEDLNLLGPKLIASWMAYLPPIITPPMSRWMSTRSAQVRLQNLTISNVPGPRERGHLGGAMLREFYSVGPLVVGSGMNITVWSYVDQLNISVLVDDKTLPDAHEATDTLIHAFTEIRTAAGLSGELTAVDTAMEAARGIA